MATTTKTKRTTARRKLTRTSTRTASGMEDWMRAAKSNGIQLKITALDSNNRVLHEVITPISGAGQRIAADPLMRGLGPIVREKYDVGHTTTTQLKRAG
jgi:hypothetical protein